MQMVSDPNFLYLDLMNANEDLRELKKELGDDVGEERLRLYKAFKAVSGLGDPVATKTQEKKVKGLLRSVFGSSPKLGLFQRRVLGAAVDTVGRGVITPNPNLNMDQVGLPEDKAWVIFRPFVIRNLVRRGMGAQAAARSVADQTAVAYKALLEEMNRRPVVINRAPVLHRYGMMAAWATPVKGSTLQIPPIVTPGFNADFDGNCLVGSSKIVLTFAANGRSLSSLAHIEEEYAMKFSKSSTIILVTDELTVVEAAIADVPIVAGSLQHDKNGAEVYAVPAGVRTLSYDDTTGRPVWKDVQRLTIERARETVRVSLRSGHAVICTPNESMAVYNHETGRLEKRAPADAVGSLCAIIREQPVVGGQGNFEHGWLLGAFVSDGFLMRGQSHVRIGYAKCDDAKRERFAAAVEAYEGGPVKRNTYRAIPGEKKLGRAVKDHYARAPRTLELFQRCYTAAPSGNIRAALLKTLPPLGMFNRETLLGILSGLLDGDGSLSVSNAKKQPQIMSNFSTSSPALVDSVRTLGRLLGLRVSATAYEPKEGRQQRHTAWIVTFSTVDLARLAPELRLTDSTGAALLKDLEAQELKDDRDIVPVPAAVMASATSKLGVLGEHEMRKSLCTIKSKTNPAYYVTRSFARKLLARFDAVQIDDEALQAALRQLEAVVAATSVGWSPIKTVEAAAVEDVYDLEIPDTKVFATNGGMIVWDTMNYHVPVSKEAVQDAIDKMLPSRNLKDTSAFDVHYYPRQEFLHGLHLASAAKKKGRPKTFVSREAALAAYERGEVSVDDPVVILGD